MLEALSTNLGETFRSVIASFRLSSLFPALCFVFLHHYCLLPYLAQQGIPLLPEGEESLVLLLLLTALISYALRYLNFPIIRVVEGFPVRKNVIGKKMIEWHKARYDRLKQQQKLAEANLMRQRDTLTGMELEQQKEILSVAKARQLEIETVLDDHYPREKGYILPTALGNVMAAFEAYPQERYGIDAVYMWPRILPVLDEEGYAPFVDREKEGFDFFLNFAVLSGLLTFELVMLRLFFAFQSGLDFPSPTILSWASLITGCQTYLFYRAAIANARNWGEMIKTAFDLYRYSLAEKLFIKPFSDYDNEKNKWQAMSIFVQKTKGGFLNFDYPLPRRQQSE